MSAEPADICTRSAASLVTSAALWPELLLAVVAGSIVGWAGTPGRKSTLIELLPGRTVWRSSPATTSTSRGGSTVRFVTEATGPAGAEKASTPPGFFSGAARCFGLTPGREVLAIAGGWAAPT